MKIKSLLGMWCSLVLMCCAIPGASAQKVVEIHTPKSEQTFATDYEKRRTFRGSMYRKDPNAWVFNSGFRQRFDMPFEWVDESLPEGIAGMAIRHQPFYVDICPPGEDCYQPANCYLDIYATDKAKLPWLNDKKGHLDLDFPDSPWFHLKFNAKDFNAIAASRGLDMQWFDAQAQRYPARVVEYERNMLGELHLLSTIFPCDKLHNGTRLALSGKGEAVEITLPTEFVKRAQAKITENKTTYPGRQEATFRLALKYDELQRIKTHTPLMYHWAYTEAFANRYSLPEQWISEDIHSGLEAVAYRNQEYAMLRCGFFREDETCFTDNTYTRLDVFLNKNLELGWKDRKSFEYNGANFHLSEYFLIELGFDYNNVDRTVFENSKSLFSIDKSAGFFGWKRKVQTAENPIQPTLYQQEINNLSFFSVHYARLIEYGSNKYMDDKWYFYSKHSAISPRVELIIPGSFLERVKYASQQQDPKDSLVEAVMKRFKLN